MGRGLKLAVAGIAAALRCVAVRHGSLEPDDDHGGGGFDAADSPATATSTWCAAVSGNGGNWASTVGFLAEALRIHLRGLTQADAVDLRCVTGGSSGSAVTLLVMNLLLNEELGVPGGVATKAQAEVIARGMHWVSQAFDLSYGAIFETVTRLVGVKLQQWSKLDWKRNFVAVGIGGNMLQFKHGLVLGRFVKRSWLDMEVRSLIVDHCGLWNRNCDFNEKALRAVADKFSLKTVTDLPEAEAAATALEMEQLRHIMQDISVGVKRRAKEFLGCAGTCGFVTSAWRRNWIQTFDSLTEGEPTDGFMTAAFVAPRYRNRHIHSSEPADSITYSDLQVLMLMNRHSATTLLGSATYRQQLAACQNDGRDSTACAHADRFIVGVVATWRPMLKLSTMEPGMQRFAVDKLSALGLVAFFDPLGQDLGGGQALRLTEITPGSGRTDPVFGVLGGFVDRGQSVAMLEHYQETRTALGSSAPVAYAMFGKNQPPKTAVSAIKTLLTYSGSAEEQEIKQNASWDDYSAWSSHRPSGLYDDGMVDWDCGAGLPANVDGRSWLLRLHGAARARVAAGAGALADFMAGCEAGGSVLAKSEAEDASDVRDELPPLPAGERLGEE